MENILKNPTFVAVVAGALAYSYLSWKKRENNKKRKNKNKKIINNNDDVLYSFVIAIIVWFLMYGYLNYKQTPQMNQNNQMNPNLQNFQMPQNLNTQLPTYKLVKELSESPKSFTLMQNGSGLVMPLGNNPMPEVFIDNF
jgi:hypothetical protein